MANTLLQRIKYGAKLWLDGTVPFEVQSGQLAQNIVSILLFYWSNRLEWDAEFFYYLLFLVRSSISKAAAEERNKRRL